jgi:hypothetical protein
MWSLRITVWFLSCHFCSCQFWRLRLTTFYYCSILHPVPQKTPSSVVKNACLLVHYLAMDVLLLSVFIVGMCLLNRCLAMDIHGHSLLIFRHLGRKAEDKRNCTECYGENFLHHQYHLAMSIWDWGQCVLVLPPICQCRGLKWYGR